MTDTPATPLPAPESDEPQRIDMNALVTAPIAYVTIGTDTYVLHHPQSFGLTAMMQILYRTKELRAIYRKACAKADGDEIQTRVATIEFCAERICMLLVRQDAKQPFIRPQYLERFTRAQWDALEAGPQATLINLLMRTAEEPEPELATREAEADAANPAPPDPGQS